MCMSTRAKKYVVVGKLAGLSAGAVFAILMAVSGMFPMVAGLVGSSNAFVGLIVHLILSAAIGGFYGLLVKEPNGWNFGKHTLLGMVYGFAWWVVGALVIMPLLMGGDIMLNSAGMNEMIPSLVGHVVFGLVFGLVYAKMLYDGCGCCASVCDKKEGACPTDCEEKCCDAEEPKSEDEVSEEETKEVSEDTESTDEEANADEK